jgi:hypothetical protein
VAVASFLATATVGTPLTLAILAADEVPLVPGMGGSWSRDRHQSVVWCVTWSRASASRALRVPGQSVPLWVLEVSGSIDPRNEAHDLVMLVFGGRSKGERNRIKIRVGAAMGAQAKDERRFATSLRAARLRLVRRLRTAYAGPLGQRRTLLSVPFPS